ncbi:hypothetical protein [Vibrio barjaei]|uniref:hypothetical protein n=1 Tax=Vibrio barjaei TaxID=1676683 RepID=UPI0022844A03|nr:hypothetical protein [Vibrio barjaei]MCY9870355.1 hypothetical protein [Vibrio barjaei]
MTPSCNLKRLQNELSNLTNKRPSASTPKTKVDVHALSTCLVHQLGLERDVFLNSDTTSVPPTVKQVISYLGNDKFEALLTTCTIPNKTI